MNKDTKRILNDITDVHELLFEKTRLSNACGQTLEDELELQYKIQDIKSDIEDLSRPEAANI